MSRPSNLFPIAFALGVTILAPAADAQPTKTTQNCISNYYVVDGNGQCIGDLIINSTISPLGAAVFGCDNLVIHRHYTRLP